MILTFFGYESQNNFNALSAPLQDYFLKSTVLTSIAYS